MIYGVSQKSILRSISIYLSSFYICEREPCVNPVCEPCVNTEPCVKAGTGSGGSGSLSNSWKTGITTGDTKGDRDFQKGKVRAPIGES